MHHHLEVVMPPTDDSIEAVIKHVLAPFDEGDDKATIPFWDWWVIGGRWAGAKVTHGLELDPFYDELARRKVTVSGVQCGKQTLQPASQIEMVDALWRDFFPNCPIRVCPLFDHYKGGLDVMKLGEVPKDLNASRVIIAGPDWEDKKCEAVYMVCDEIWNGVNHVKTTWDGTLKGALDGHAEKIANYKDDYAAKRTPRDDWLVVTVDYHS